LFPAQALPRVLAWNPQPAGNPARGRGSRPEIPVLKEGEMKNVLSVLTCLLASSFAAFGVDDRGNTATQGAETWSRAAQYMLPKPKLVNGHITLVLPLKIEVSQVMDPAAPQSPFAQPWSLTPNPTVFFGPNGVTTDSSQAIFGHAGNGEAICGDIGGQGTQMDALGHFGLIKKAGDTPAYFGGLTQSEVVGPAGLKRLGIERAEPIITSVVMLDAARHLNNGKALAPGYAITKQDIEDIVAAQGLAGRGIKSGDAVFIHTGYGAAWASSPSTYYTQGPGLSHEAAVFLASRKIALVGLDNPFTDAAVNQPGAGPFPPMASWENGSNPWLPFGAHHHNLTQAGVHQIQNLNLTEMAQKKVYLGAVFILPIRFKGAAGSPVRPVVIGHPND
jgi:kynurenine formamidase